MWRSLFFFFLGSYKCSLCVLHNRSVLRCGRSRSVWNIELYVWVYGANDLREGKRTERGGYNSKSLSLCGVCDNRFRVHVCVRTLSHSHNACYHLRYTSVTNHPSVKRERWTGMAGQRTHTHVTEHSEHSEELGVETERIWYDVKVQFSLRQKERDAVSLPAEWNSYP